MADTKLPPRALEGIKVVEVSCFDNMPNYSAAMAGKAFADHGAEVIKIEPPGTGAPERLRGPFKDELPDPETGGVHGQAHSYRRPSGTCCGRHCLPAAAP